MAAPQGKVIITCAVTGFGVTVSGASNVLTLSMAGAVSVSPDAAVAVVPTRRVATSAGCVGWRFVNESHSVPAESRAAIASTRGSFSVPCVYVPAS